MDFKAEMDIAELPDNFDSSDLMSSEFFDSIFSLEKSEFENEVIESELLNAVVESPESDGINCDASTFSDSGLSSDPHDLDLSEHILNDGSLLQSILTDNVEILSPENSQIGDEVEEPKIELNQQSTKQPHINLVKPIQASHPTKQIIKVQPVCRNGRSVYLPLNIKDLKAIKFINPGPNCNFKPVKKIKTKNSSRLEERNSSASPTSDVDSDAHPISDGSQYPILKLTEEEKRLLVKDGITLPTRYPLTKHEERELKRIRRKIRNKISAQDSRKRKKEYVEGLEERVKQCTEENKSLLKRIKVLQSQNSRLSTQLSKLQNLVFSSGTSKAHPAACFLVVLLSVMLVTLPNLRNVAEEKQLYSLQEFVARRALLFTKIANEDTINMDEFLTFHSKTPESDESYIPTNSNKHSFEKLILTPPYDPEIISGHDDLYSDLEYNAKDAEVMVLTKNAINTKVNPAEPAQKRKFDVYDQTLDDNGAVGKKFKGYFEPDIEDEWPGQNKMGNTVLQDSNQLLIKQLETVNFTNNKVNI